MYAPAAALAWEFWGRYRWGFSAFGVYVVVYAIVTAVAPGANPEMFASLGSMWFVMGLGYLTVVFAYGSDVRLETADSGFPPRFFRLPVRTSVLVGWPMLQGVLVTALAWVVWDRFVLHPCGIETPFWWQAMLAAVVVTTQTLLWVPFGLPWVRLPVALVVLTVLVRAPVFLALAGERFTEPDTENAILTAFAAGLIPIAYFLARAGVGRARRGDSPDWLRGVGALRPGRELRILNPFSAPMRAQVWYEWRLRGRGFPILVQFTLGVLMVCGALVDRDNAMWSEFTFAFLATPVLLACFCGSYLGTTGDSVQTLSGFPAFGATRPMSNAALVGAKLRVAARAAAAGWLTTLAFALVWLTYTGGIRTAPNVWEQAVTAFGSTRTCVLGVLLVVGPIFVIWRLLVENIWVGLTGRVWVTHTVAIVGAVVAVEVMHAWTQWGVDANWLEQMRAVLPWTAGAAVAFKFLLAGWALRILHRRGELKTGAVVRLLCAWGLVVALLFAVLLWLLPSDRVPVSDLAVGVVLFVPFARLVAAPLALAWNRHR